MSARDDPVPNRPTVISLFTGGMGLDLGFELSGFDVRVSVDKDPWAAATVKANRPRVGRLTGDIQEVTTEQILEVGRLEPGQATVLTGGPPCEPFSTAGRRGSIQDGRAQAIFEFLRVVREARPWCFVMEQVPGFLRAAKQHMSFYDRIAWHPENLPPEYRLGSAFDEIMAEIASTGYALSFRPEYPKESVLNAADYGSPQKRRRFILIGVREGSPIPLPAPTHGPEGSGRTPWVTIGEAFEELKEQNPEFTPFTDAWAEYLPLVPPGGCWRDIPNDLHADALGGAYDFAGTGLKGGRTGFLRRLSWDQPSPTLVDSPKTKAMCMCHPDEDRPLSIAEYARIQGFPPNWHWAGPITAKYRLIGQATPVPLAAAIARAVAGQYESRHQLVPN